MGINKISTQRDERSSLLACTSAVRINASFAQTSQLQHERSTHIAASCAPGCLTCGGMACPIRCSCAGSSLVGPWNSRRPAARRAREWRTWMMRKPGWWMVTTTVRWCWGGRARGRDMKWDSRRGGRGERSELERIQEDRTTMLKCFLHGG